MSSWMFEESSAIGYIDLSIDLMEQMLNLERNLYIKNSNAIMIAKNRIYYGILRFILENFGYLVKKVPNVNDHKRMIIILDECKNRFPEHRIIWDSLKKSRNFFSKHRLRADYQFIGFSRKNLESFLNRVYLLKNQLIKIEKIKDKYKKV